MSRADAETGRGGPLRVLVVSHSLSGGGAERFASYLAAALDRRRFAASLCLVTDRLSYELPEHVPVSRLGYGGLRHLPRTVWRLARAMRRTAPHVVLSNVLSTNCLTGAALLLVAPRPAWIARVANAPELSEPAAQRWWAHRVYGMARRVVVNSQYMLPAFAREYPRVAPRAVSLPNPTDFDLLERRASAEPIRRRPAGHRTLLWVGRLTAQKRPDLALATLAQLRKSVDARLWLCGEGPLEGAVRRRVAELGLEDAVEVLGFCDNPHALMREADLLLLTSDHEGLPNALIEAQGLGLAAVATRCPYGPAEIVEEGVSGLLVPVGDADALARAAGELLADDALRERMGREGRRRARERYGLEAVLPRWQDLLEAVFAEGP